MSKKLRLAVLASGRGSNLQAILDAHLEVSVSVVLSDKREAKALDRARDLDIPAYWVNPKEFQEKSMYEAALLDIIRKFEVDCIILAGYMRVLSPFFIRNASVPIMNIHPSLLPSFTGLHAQKQAIDYGVKFSGCTVHFVDEGVDTGPIILQEVVPVYPDDTEDSLSLRILEKEHEIFPKAISLFSQGRIKCQGRKVLILREGENCE